MVRERCSCGAEFESDDESAVKLLRDWRRKHRCVQPMSGERPGLTASLDMVAADERSPEMHIGFRPSIDD